LEKQKMRICFIYKYERKIFILKFKGQEISSSKKKNIK